jgi:hypothetical protein
MKINNDIQNLLKDFKLLQQNLEKQSKDCSKMIDNMSDSEMKTLLKKSYEQAVIGKLDIDLFLKNISKCQQ